MWKEYSYILSPCCFSYISIILFLESTKELHCWLRKKSKWLELQLFFFTKSDVKAVAPDGSFYLSPTDALSAALSYLSDTLRLFLQTIAGGNMEEQTASVGQALIQCMRAKDLPPSLYIDFVIQIGHHFGSRFFNRLTTWAPILQPLLKRGRNMSAVLQLQSADLPYNQFNKFVADNVDHNLVTLDCLHIPWDVFYCICYTG